MKTILAILALTTLTGCFGVKHKTPSAPTRVSQFATTPVPTPPPLPDPTPIAQDVTGAATDVNAAQTDVRQVIQMATTIPAAAPALSTLNAADTRLTAAAQKLDDASARIVDLNEKLNASEQAHATAESLMKGDIEKLKTAATADATQATKQVTALEVENTQLRNEALNSVRKTLFWIGSILMLGALISVYLSFQIGFVVGKTLAAFLGLLGFVVIGFAGLLPRIQEYAEIAVVGGFIVLLVSAGLFIYHGIKHEPLKAGEMGT